MNCRICLHSPAQAPTTFCLECVKKVRNDHLCPDCDGEVVVFVGFGINDIKVNVHHAPECPVQIGLIDWTPTAPDIKDIGHVTTTEKGWDE